MVAPDLPETADIDPVADHRYSFEDFELWPKRRVLIRGGAPVPIGGRALDLLIALVERAGQVVSKTELFALVWPNITVEESNLRVHIAAVRKALGGAHFITSVPGRGYSFVADAVRTSGRAQSVPQRAKTSPDHADFPAVLTQLFGRDEVIAELSDQLPRKRLITIAGTGGIGKTAVALAVARRVADAYRDGVQVIDLALLAQPSLLPAHLASLLRLPAVDEKEPLRTFRTHLRARRQLILLDNCEHVLDDASEIAETILAHAPNVHLLATSREPLRAAYEWVHRLTPLEVPLPTSTLRAPDAMRYAAVQLFVERLRAWDGSFEPTDGDARVIAEICARLDGLPLAIELAVTRASLFGLEGLADRLDDRFSILTRGRRTAASRHQTLSSMIDWSYEGLSDVERLVWRRLSVFPGPFTLEAVDTIVNAGLPDDTSTINVLDNLLQKSLIVTDVSGEKLRYRLLESLRLYASAKALDNGETQPLRRRHAQYCYNRSMAAGDNWVEVPDSAWLAAHSGELADLRAAIDWAFAPGGDPVLGVKLTAASAPIWFKMLLLPELRRHLERAIVLAEGMPEIDDAVRIRLYVALGHAIFHGVGPVPEVADALGAAYKIARRAGNLNYELQALWGLYGHHSTYGNYEPMAAAVSAVAALYAEHPEPIVAATYNRMAALSLHLLGDQAAALRHAEEALQYPAVQRHDGGFVYDHRTASSAHYCRILWVMGRPDQAAQVIAHTLEHVNRVDQVFAFGYFLVFGACPVAIWSGDLAALQHYVDLLLDDALGVPLTIWRTEGEFYARVLAFRKVPEAERTPADLARLFRQELTPYQAERVSTFARRVLHPDPVAHALSGAVNWCTAEILRRQAEILLVNSGVDGRLEAEALFLRAIDISQEQKALAWELRSSVSLARLLRETGRTSAARDILSSVCVRFTEGFSTREVMEAKALVEALR